MESVNELKDYIRKKRFKVTDHAFEEMEFDNFSIEDIIDGIISDEIIEEYPVAYPLPACLVNGRTEEGRPIHICISLPPFVKIITVYEPDVDKWDDNFRKRRHN